MRRGPASLLAAAAVAWSASAGAAPTSAPAYGERGTRRGPELEVGAEVGYERIDLATFRGDYPELLEGLLPRGANAPVVGLGAGVRLEHLTVGARLRVAVSDHMQLFTAGPELTAHRVFGRLEPRVTLGAGYASVGGLRDTTDADLSGFFGTLHGFHMRGAAGLDFHLLPVLTLGATASYDVLILHRTALDADTVNGLWGAATVTENQAAALAVDGTSYGSAVALTLAATVRF